jgi:hypothetical protein
MTGRLLKTYRIPGRVVREKLGAQGIILPKELQGHFHVTHLQNDTPHAKSYMGVEYFPKGSNPSWVHAPRTAIDAVMKSQGLLIVNGQSKASLSGADVAQIEEAKRFMDSKAGMHLGLNLIRESMPNTKVHIITPSEARRLYGERSLDHLVLPDGFLSHIKKLPANEYETLVRRLMFEHPDYVEALRGNVLQPELVARLSREIKRTTAQSKAVGGSRGLKRAFAEYAKSSKHPAIGKGMSKAYYHDIPLQHGFHENMQPMDFDGFGKLHVLTLEPGERKKIWEEHVSKD